MTAPTGEQRSETRRKGEDMLRLIGAFKLVKSFLLVGAALATLRLVHADIGEVVLEWAHRLHVAPGNKLVQRALEIKPGQLKVIAALLGMYAVMYSIEGVGLLLLKHWAEWMTVVTTCGLVPIEVYEIFREATVFRIAAFVINVGIAVYLIWMLKRQHGEKKVV